MNSFRINNIKSFVDSGDIEIKPITIFVGRNSSGKSSLIRFPIVLAQTAMADSDSPIKFYGNMVDYGNFEDVLHKGSEKNLGFELEYLIDVNLDAYSIFDHTSYIYSILRENIEKKEKDLRNIKINVCFKKIRKTIVVETIELKYGEKCLYKINRETKDVYKFSIYYKYINGNYVDYYYSVSMRVISFDKFIPIYDSLSLLKGVIDSTSLSKEEIDNIKRFMKNYNAFHAKQDDDLLLLSKKERSVIETYTYFDYMSNLLRTIFRRYQNECRNIRYIGPFRVNPDRYYRDAENISNNVGVHGENMSNILIRDSRKSEKKLIQNISAWTSEVLGFKVVVRDITNGMYQIMLKDQQGNETNLIDNGFGVSQVLPIVTEVIRLSLAKPVTNYGKIISDNIVVLEQPELHLHPAAQSELADLFVESIISGKGKKKILIETHSEHLIRKLQVIIADKNNSFSKDMIKFYYIDKDENGKATVEEMKILDNGKFVKPWPSGFFDKGYQLSRDLARAGIEK